MFLRPWILYTINAWSFKRCMYKPLLNNKQCMPTDTLGLCHHDGSRGGKACPIVWSRGVAVPKMAECQPQSFPVLTVNIPPVTVGLQFRGVIAVVTLVILLDCLALNVSLRNFSFFNFPTVA